MKKTMLGILAGVILISLIVAVGLIWTGNQAQPDTTPTSLEESNLQTEEITEEYASVEEEVLQEAGETTPSCVGFGTVDTLIDGENIFITGSVFDDVTSGELYCNGNEETPVAVFDITGGEFSIETAYNKCGPGTGILKYECNGESKVARVNIPSQFTIIRSGGGSPPASVEPIHTPEFSLVTLTLAVLGAGLLLAFLRKN